MPTFSYSLADFRPFTKIRASDLNTKFSDLATFLNGQIGNSNIAANSIDRNTKLSTGTANYVVINDSGGNMSQEAQLSTTRGGLGFAPTVSAGNAGKAVVVNDAGNSLALGSPIQPALTEQLASDVSDITAGEAITDRDAVCLALAEDASGNSIYRIFRCDSDLSNRKNNFFGFATAAATVTAHTLTWTDSAALVSSNVITWSINHRSYSVSFTTDNDTTLQAIATQIQTDPDIQSASVVDAGSNDRVINITGKGGLRINITGATVTGGASQATITIATTQSPSGDAVSVRVFGPLSGFSGLTIGSKYYVSSTTGAITAAPTDSNPVQTGQALSSTVLFVNSATTQFLFPSSGLFVKTHGSTTNAAATASATTEHFNFTSWSSGTSDTEARNWGQGSECNFGSTALYYIDGVTTGGTSSLRTASYNKTSWTIGLPTRSTGKAVGAQGTFSGMLLIGNGAVDAGTNGVSTMDGFNGSSWSNALADFTNGRHSNGCFVEGGFMRFINGLNGGASVNKHDTWNGTSASTATLPANQGPCRSTARVTGGGVHGGSNGNATTSETWNGSAWTAKTMTYAPESSSGGTANGSSAGYNEASGNMYINGGYNGSALNTTASMNGSSWLASTASSQSRSSPTGGVF